MRAVVQRVTKARVTVEGKVVGEVEAGLCLFVGVMEGDEAEDASILAKKVVQLRIFEDEEGKMNHAVRDTGGRVLAVSQFTLAGDVRKGNRPSFVRALSPGPARQLFERFCDEVRALGIDVATGTFRAHMNVSIENDGPVTILLDTKKAF